jgi:hypothetical protein
MDQEPTEITVISVTKPKAKSRHECCYIWCKKPIEIGEKYMRYVYLDEDGQFQCLHSHLEHWPLGGET